MEKRISRVAVVGTGTLGTQIAILAAYFGNRVSAFDIDRESFKRGLRNLKDVIRISGRRAILPVEEWEKSAKRVEICNELEEALRNADLVIEAVPEDPGLKRAVFEKLNALAPQEALLATNSSCTPISRIESATARPEHCLNIHFYYPAMGINIVDVMGGTRTTVEAIESAKAWIRSIGCVPLVVNKEVLGFCFNRIWRAIKRESLYLWAEGFVDFRDIDRAWMIFTGMAQGPFGLMDAVGLDVVYNIEMVYYKESNDLRDHPPEALKAMVDMRELGTSTGRGFYTYPNPEFGRPDFLKG